jgi:hypothetical protein
VSALSSKRGSRYVTQDSQEWTSDQTVPHRQLGAIEFDDEHGDRVVGVYMWTAWSWASAAIGTLGMVPKLPPRVLYEDIDVAAGAPNSPRVLSRSPNGKSAVIKFDDEHGEWVVGEYVLVGWDWAPAAERAKAEEILRKPPIAIYGRPPKDPRWRQ